MSPIPTGSAPSTPLPPSLSAREYLISLQGEVAQAREELASLRLQLESLRYAADLTRDEVARRSLASSPTPQSSSPIPIAPVHQIEEQLLEAKSEAALVRKRVEQLDLHARTLRRRTRIDVSEGRDSRSELLSPKLSRRKAKRNIADFDALVAPSSESELLPCRVTVSADGIVSVYAVTVPFGSMSAASDPVMQLFPPYSRISDISMVEVATFRDAGQSRPLTISMAKWMSSVNIRVSNNSQKSGNRTEGCNMVLCGIRDSVLDAHAIIQGRTGEFAKNAAHNNNELEKNSPGHADSYEEEMFPDGLVVKARKSDDSETAESTLARYSQKFNIIEKSGVISGPVMTALLEKVPARFLGSSLRLLYSTREHGMSLLSLYRNSMEVSPTILAIRDTGGARFGCFATAPWIPHSRPLYYGGGESFCWKIVGESGVEIYPWSKTNSYFQSSTSSFLAIGGGLHYAIRIDSELRFGTSGESTTYNNSCLSSKEDFECVVLELWGLEIPKRHSSQLLIL